MRRPRLLGLSLPRLAAVAGAFVLSTLSCGREITGPNGTRFARGLSFVAEYPGEMASLEDGAGSVIAFNRVRVIFRRMDGAVALERIVQFPANATEIPASFDVPLSSGVGPEGEPLSLFLRYINAAGDTVFAGGPVSVIARPTISGVQAPPPASVPLVYTGLGSEATSVVIAPDTTALVSGDPFALTATAYDAQMNPVPLAPLVWSSLNTTMARLDSVGLGSGSTLPSRGWARVRVALAAGGGADTAWLNIAPRAGSLQLVSGGGQTASIAAILPDSIRLRVLATDGLAMANVWVRFAATTGGGLISADSALSDSLGYVGLRWTLGASVGTQTLTASIAGTTATATINATAEAATLPSLVLATPPQSGVAGTLLADIFVEVRDAQDVLVTDYADSVEVSVFSGPGEASLLGIRRVQAVGGIATFDSLALTLRGTYTLMFAGVGVLPVTAAPISIAPGAPFGLLLLSGGAQNAPPSSVLPDSIVAHLLDEFGNGVPGVAVVPGGGSFGSVSPASVNSDSTGRVAFRWTLGAETTPQLLELTVPGFDVPPLLVSANLGDSTVASTEVALGADTLHSIGETTLLTATARDLFTNVVSGTFTFVSGNPAVATVDSTGLVTAVADGSAWLHAIESGGTRDSTLIVVQQLLASIVVTPASRQLYLGTTFQFAAQAVDGLGVPMLTQPAFTWNSQNLSVALVDSTGLVSTVGLGGTQIQATAGAVTGVSAVTVVTPITRIAVIRDSIGFSVTDTFTLVALQRPRSYRAVAYDTLDAPMTGIAFTWVSSNPSVAAVDSTGSETVRARAQANGITAIRASAQGVTGAASLRVQQVLADIDLSPDAASIAPTGNTLLTARGLDPDGFNLPSISGVTFTSLTTAIATVNASSGLVTGVANGTALITANVDTVLADTVTITVGGAVPAVISFGRDSLAIGRSASQSIPIYLSRPHTSPLTVELAVADTFAYFSTASITIPTGATSGNATLNGRNAGSTQVFAVDGSAAGYAGDTATLAVQANVRFSTTSYSILATNELATQVLLSDPAPAGGTFVTYSYGTPGITEVSPNPAFIPQGQLSVNVVIRGLSGGSSTITPVATGVNGQSATVTVSPAVLDLIGTTHVMGVNTQRADLYVYVGANASQPIPISLTSSDTTVLRVNNTTIPAGIYYAYFSMTAVGTGDVWLHSSAPGFTSDSVRVFVTTLSLDACCDATRQTTSPPQNFSITVRDSVGGAYNRTTPLVVQIASSDTNVVRLASSTATVPAGANGNFSIQYTMAGAIGSAWIRTTASGVRPDSILITVQGPKLSFSYTSSQVGAGQRNTGSYVYVPNNTAQPLVVHLTNTSPSTVQIPDSVIIPAGTYYVYFNADGLAPGSATFYASALGHEPDTATFVVSTPRIDITGGGTLNNFAPPFGTTVIVRDSAGNAYPRIAPLGVALSSSDTTVLRVTDSVTVGAGASSSNAATVTIVGPGTAWIRVSAAGHGVDSVSYTVQDPQLSLSFNTYVLGRRQSSGPSSIYVHVPNNVTDTLPVTLTHTNPTAVALSTTTPSIPTGIYYRYFAADGLAFGVDTIVASAPGYRPDTAVIHVSSTRFSIGSLPATRTTTDPVSGFGVTIVDSLGTSHPSLDTVVVSVVSSAPGVLQPVLPSYRILPGITSVNPQVAFVGPGSGFITVSDSLGAGYVGGQTNTVTVTGPSLFLVNSSPQLGMRQNSGGGNAYVYVQNNVTGQPLVVNLASSDPSVATVPATVTIPVGTYYAYFNVTAHDVVGTVQIQATAAGYSPATVNQEVTAPRFVVTTATTVRTTQGLQVVNVYATDAAGTQHPTNEAVVVNLASSSTAVGTIDSATVTIPAGASQHSTARFRPLTPGTTQLSATDPRSEGYRYNTGTVNVSVTLPSLQFSWGGSMSVGIGQYTDDYYVYTQDNQVAAVVANLSRATGRSVVADTTTINAGTYYRYVRIGGGTAGADTLRASAAGFVDSPPAGVNVGLGRVDGITNWPTTLATDSVQVTLYTRAPDASIRRVSEATTFTLAATGNVQFAVGGATVASVVVPADGISVSFWVKRLPGGGTANVSISAANYATYNSNVVVSP
ncbi:MAG: Ig-like domain-containing protein [Gemmatimonadaceae bacterium]|nr:Ig-like domain-containing protein [Gemmatimonadaceae bacterium]